MILLIGALSMGLVLSLLGLGVYISYRILDTFDLTVDGSFAFGAVIAGVLVSRGVASFCASAAGFLAGMAAGALSGMIHQRLGVSRLPRLICPVIRFPCSQRRRDRISIPPQTMHARPVGSATPAGQGRSAAS